MWGRYKAYRERLMQWCFWPAPTRNTLLLFKSYDTRVLLRTQYKSRQVWGIKAWPANHQRCMSSQETCISLIKNVLFSWLCSFCILGAFFPGVRYQYCGSFLSTLIIFSLIHSQFFVCLHISQRAAVHHTPGLSSASRPSVCIDIWV